MKELDLNDLKSIEKINLFLKENDADYMQSIEWNKIRNEKKKFYLYAVDEKNNILWSCSLLEKSNKNEKYLYAPRGPIYNLNNPDLFKNFLENIKSWMQQKGYKKLVINPYIELEKVNKILVNYHYTILKPNDYENLHESCKLAIMDIIFDEEELINKLPSKFRQNTRRSYRKGLTYKIPQNIDLDNFYKLYLETSVRHDFKPHDKEYFQKIIEVFKEKIVFLEVWYENLPLAMSIDITYNNKLIYLYGVSASENRNLLGMYCMQWEAIKYCIQNKIPEYDFGGVFCEENDLENKDYGLYKFKKGYCYKGFKDIVPDIVFEFEKE